MSDAGLRDTVSVDATDLSCTGISISRWLTARKSQLRRDYSSTRARGGHKVMHPWPGAKKPARGGPGLMAMADQVLRHICTAGASAAQRASNASTLSPSCRAMAGPGG